MRNGEKGEADRPPTPTPRRSLPQIRDWWDGVLNSTGPAGTVLVGAIITVLAAGGAWLLVPPRSVTRIPFYEVGDFSRGVIKADKDYTIPDEETTAHKREEGAQAVLPIYDFDRTASIRAARRVHEAFGMMQRAYEDYQLRLADAPPVPDENAKTPAQGAEPALVAPPEDPKAVRQVFLDHKDEFLQILQVVIEESEFATLSRARFSTRLENGISGVVEGALSVPVVADQALLAAVREDGITVRAQPPGAGRPETNVTDVDARISDVAATRERMADQLAEVLSDEAPEVRMVAGRIARRLVSANLTFNPEETDLRRQIASEKVKPVVIQVGKGEKILGDGERIEESHLRIFRGIRAQAETTDALRMYIGGGLIALLFTLSLFAFARGGVWGFRPSRKDLLFLLSMLLGTLLLTRAGLFFMTVLSEQYPNIPEDAFFYALPVGAAIILVRLVLSGEITMVFAAILSMFAGILADGSLAFALYLFAGSVVGADFVRRARSRAGIWRAGFMMSIVNVVVVIAIGLHDGGKTFDVIAMGAAGAATTGFIAPLIVLGLASMADNVFGYTTDLKLLELANVNNPLLKELVVVAPGTYQHSMVIGSMVESAAEAIGANPLLARVGAYYHDIGKGKNPLYFAENQRGENPHDKLAPSMSALIIRRHVTDGIAMAREAGLPSPIVDMIPMHHGTRLMAYFWHRAKEEAERKEEPEPEEVEYRHIGPKPGNREAALLMIADSVEAASRTLTEPNSDRLRGLIQKVINNCFADGQFDEVDITLKDLHAVTRSFVRSLEAIYHTRPEYQQPADKSEKTEERARKADGEEKGNGRKEVGKTDSKKEERKDEKKDERRGEKKGEKKDEKKGEKKVTSKKKDDGTPSVKSGNGSPRRTGQDGADDAAPAEAAAGAVSDDNPDREPTGEHEALKRLGTD